MGRTAWLVVVLAAAIAAGACSGGRSAVDVSAGTPTSTVAPASSPSTAIQAVPGTNTSVAAPASTASPPSTTSELPTTASGRIARPAPATSVPASASVTVASTTSTTAGTVTTTTTATTTTSPPLVPVLLDARQGFGAPCDPASTRNPPGCFFFVYATTATRGLLHRLYSDAAFTTEPMGATCGTQSVHHGGEDTCSWYLGPVYGRTAGQQECFWATTVSGGRESEPSDRVCLNWTNQVP